MPKGERETSLGLETSFCIVISNIINIKPLPSIDNAYGMILREELARKITHDQDTRFEGVAFGKI